MITIRKVPAEKFYLFKEIFEQEFNSDLPLPENSEIFCACEDGEVLGFLLAENVVMIGQIYVVPKMRKNSGKIAQSLVRFVRHHIAPTNTVGAVASETRFNNLFKSFGMQHIKGMFFRRNIDF